MANWRGGTEMEAFLPACRLLFFLLATAATAPIGGGLETGLPCCFFDKCKQTRTMAIRSFRMTCWISLHNDHDGDVPFSLLLLSFYNPSRQPQGRSAYYVTPNGNTISQGFVSLFKSRDFQSGSWKKLISPLPKKRNNIYVTGNYWGRGRICDAGRNMHPSQVILYLG